MKSFIYQHRQTIVKVLWKTAAGLIFLLSTINFMSFILEEAIQARGFGLFPLISNKMWGKADAYIKTYEPAIRKDLATIRLISKFNILAGAAFEAYANAEEDKLDSNKSFIAYMLKQQIRKEKLAQLKRVNWRNK